MSHTLCVLIVGLTVWVASPLHGQDTLRLPIVRDTWVSAVGDEANCNLGGADRLKLKSIQEMSLVDFDPSPLRGRAIRQATLHVKRRGDETLHRVTVSSVSAEWVEGTSTRYQPQTGSATFRHRRHPDLPWAGPGSDLSAVVLGRGGSVWRMADATPPDRDGWQRVPVDPRVVAARVAGIGYGLLVFDDTGSEWTRNGEQFQFRLFPNRYVHSRHAAPSDRPYLAVALGPTDDSPPPAPSEVTFASERFPAGQAELTWSTPADVGPAGTIGFRVAVDGQDVPRYLIPAAPPVGGRVTMRLHDLDLTPGGEIAVEIRAVDAAGNVSSPTRAAVRTSALRPQPLAGRPPQVHHSAGPLPKLAAAEVAIIDALDKVGPTDGAMIPPQADGYLAANHLWDAARRTVRLSAARNEFVAFQVLLRGEARGVQASIAWDDAQSIHTELLRPRMVESSAGPLPDPLTPLDGPFDVEDRRNASLWCDVYVDHGARSGAHAGTLALRSGEQVVQLKLLLWVWDFTLPDTLSFLPEMNCYGLPADERAYYRLAHRHRTVLNRVPYSQNGRVSDGCAPAWDGQQLDWAAWDRRFGPLLDGSAFADLPRKGVPLEVFYLPLHENWPSSMEGNYNGHYWADQAFPPEYREAFVRASAQIAEHVEQRGWHGTMFQCYLNNKNNFKRNGWSRGSSPWLLDEPANWQDYWALRFFGEAFHEGVRQGLDNDGGRARLVYRCDISRPQWQRDALDHVLDYNVVGGGAFRKDRRLVLDRKRRYGQVVVDYGTANAVEQSNMQPVGWCWDSWTLGSDGVVPWQTIGNDGSWRKADQLALFYPGRPAGHVGPLPSIRLKAFRRGQQDAEYLTLLARTTDQPRWALGDTLRRRLQLTAEHGGTGFVGGEDAGRVDYRNLKPQDVWAVRIQIARMISQTHPPAARSLVDWRTPPRDPHSGAPGHVAGFAPQPSDVIDRPVPTSPGKTIVVQGRERVRDALIDPEQPDRKFGDQRRDNRLRRAEQCSALLLHFDLEQLQRADADRLAKATVSFFVWDPSSRGNTKVCAFPMRTEWNEDEATWRRPTATGKWQGEESFMLTRDADQAVAQVIVAPDAGNDTIDPPLEYQLDVTELVRSWLAGRQPNRGLVIAPVIDRSIDEGHFTRMQVYASEHPERTVTPKLTLHLE